MGSSPKMWALTKQHLRRNIYLNATSDDHMDLTDLLNTMQIRLVFNQDSVGDY
jgi:hypothetical protein